MQISLRYLLYLVAWSAVCILIFASLREAPVKFGVSLILCGLTLMQLPVHKMAQYGDERDSAFEYFMCIIPAGAVSASLIGGGLARLAIYFDGDFREAKLGEPFVTMGILSGTGILILYVVIHTLIYLLRSKTK